MESSTRDSRIAQVRQQLFPLPFALKAEQAGPVLIAIGMLVFLTAAWWPAVPVIGAMSLVALGATLATIARFRGMAPLRGIVAIHLAVYLSMYALFLGAVLNVPTAELSLSIPFLQIADLAMSVLVMAFVVRLSLTAIGGSGHSATR